MRITRENLTITSAACDTGRPTLEAILFDRDGTVSADGFRLTFVPYPDGPAAEGDQVVGMILPLAAAERIADVASDGSEINVAAALGASNVFEISVRSIEEVSLGAAARFTIPAVEGPYPARDKIVPTTFEHEIAFGVGFLRDALAAVEAMGGDGVRLRITGPSSPVLIEPVGRLRAVEAGPYVVLMPIFAREAGRA